MKKSGSDELSKLARFVGVKGDYDLLKSYFKSFDDKALVSLYKRAKNVFGPMEATRYINVILKLNDIELSNTVKYTLVKDFELVRCLNDKRCKKNDVIEELKEYISKKQNDEDKTKKEKHYTFHGFKFVLSDEREIEMLFSKERMKSLKAYASVRDKDGMVEFFSPYGINSTELISTTPINIKLAKREILAIKRSLRTGLFPASSFDFISKINYNFAIISEESLSKGLTEEEMNDLLGTPQITYEEFHKKPKKKSKYKTRTKCNDGGIARDLGVQELYIGQPMDVECIFNIYDLTYYIIDVPANEFIQFNRSTGMITPVKEGTVKMSVQSLDGKQKKEITLSVNEPIRRSIKSFVDKKLLLKRKQEDNQ